MIDQTFGNQGTTTAPSALTLNTNGSTSIALQSDGRIVIAGTYNGNSMSCFTAARFLPNGQLDTTFGGQNNPIPGTVIAPNIINGLADICCGVAVQSDGKIVLAGTTNYTAFSVVRLLPSGELDLTFGGQDSQKLGTAYISIGFSTNDCLAMALQPNDNIIVGGYTSIGAGNVFAVARFLSNGQIDQSFGGQNGQLAGTFYLTETIAGGTDDECFSIVVQNDGKILLGGYSCIDNNSENSRFAVVRLLSDGQLDEIFGGFNSQLGTMYLTPTISGGAGDQCYSIILQPDGKIIIAGGSGATSNQGSLNAPYFAVARLVSNGQVDITFGGQNGQNQGSMYVTPRVSEGIGDQSQDLALQPDGKIIIGGYTREQNGIIHFAAIRLAHDGALDPTFGGITSEPGTFYLVDIIISGQNQQPSLALQPNNKIILGGVCEAQFGLIQLINPMTTTSYQASYVEVGTGLY